MGINEGLTQMIPKQENELMSRLTLMFGVPEEKIRKLVSYLDFSDYIELANAVEAEDKKKVLRILGVGEKIQEISADPYQKVDTTPQKTSDNTTTDKKQEQPNSNSESNGDLTIKADKLAGLNPDEKKELEDIKKLAGLPTDEVNETATMGAITHGAMSGAVMPLNKLKRLTHVDKKPGPKTGNKK